MKDIKCPKCNTVFQVDESDYAAIVAQVRTKVFAEEVNKRMEEADARFQAKEDSLKLLWEKLLDKKIAEKDREVASLKTEIIRIEGVLAAYEANKKSQLAELESNYQLSLLKEKGARDAELQEKEKTIVKLTAELQSGKLAAQNRENQIREQHKLQLQDKQAEIDRLKDFKMKLSTKMVGETLEQHCAYQFEHAQSMGLYPNATFDKDNAAVEHSKGDFIFRDFIDGIEYVSVMFEMKNETDSNSVKHRNDDFLEKLDKDRRLKNCEYAVLVSMLEQGSELYDAGIVDKSHRFPKMIVIRPQFFLPVLRLISEAAAKGFRDQRELRSQLEEARSQSMDFAKFEDKLNRFRSAFNNNVSAAHKKFVAATEGIDKTIEALEKQIKALRTIKANFEASEQKLLRANEIADEDLTVKKLTHGNPTIRKMIEDAK